MPVNRVLAAVAVADVSAAQDWYQRLFGRPSDAIPMEGLLEWHFPSNGVVQLVDDADRAGCSLLTLGVGDLARDLEAIRERGVDAGPLDNTTSDKVYFATVTDPDGNAVTLVEER